MGGSDARDEDTRPFLRVVGRLRDFVFFFQAEDGIRDLTVTGVQTCALPISPKTLGNSEIGVRFAGKARAVDYAISYLHTRADLPAVGSLTTPPGFQLTTPHPRSEERRVGKECRSRWSPYH